MRARIAVVFASATDAAEFAIELDAREPRASWEWQGARRLHVVAPRGELAAIVELADAHGGRAELLPKRETSDMHGGPT